MQVSRLEDIVMLRRYVCAGILLAVAALVFASYFPASAQQPRPEIPAAQVPPPAQPGGSRLFVQFAAAPTTQAAAPRRTPVAADPIVITDCKLNVIDREEVPSLREGVIDFIGTEIKPGEQVPPHIRTWTIEINGQKKQIRELKEDDEIKEGDLLARLDARLATADLKIKTAKVTAAQADYTAACKLTEEGKARYDTNMSLKRQGRGAVSDEEVRGALVTWEKYGLDAKTKYEGINSARAEEDQSKVILELHDIRSKINGRIKTIYKKKGESVKGLDAMFQVYNYDRLRVEGLVETQYLRSLKKGMQVVVEPSYTEAPEQTLRGHRQEVTGVAVSNDPKNPLIVSSSDDGTVRVWDRASRYERRVLHHPMPVRAIACAPLGAAGHWCVSGCVDGVARLYDLNTDSDQPVREFRNGHRGSINCVAISSDGKLVATGGDDRFIQIWDINSSNPKYALQGHRAAVTSLQFLRIDNVDHLLSAARDNSLRVWQLAEDGGKALPNIADRRSGDVSFLGASPDGKHALIDQGRELRLVSVARRTIEGTLHNPGSAAGSFTAMALFSPDGKLALTAGSGESRVQLWRLPTEQTRAYELRQFLTGERSPPTCGAFAPDGSFIVTGSRDRQVYVWAMPSKEEIEHLLTATVIYIEQSVESTARQVRIWAELPNPDGPRRLIPGWTVTMVAYPH
jgi:WD40 repeat protein/multidrug efflux pump subunit AcrA (membrane-fusion protein)